MVETLVGIMVEVSVEIMVEISVEIMVEVLVEIMAEVSVEIMVEISVETEIMVETLVATETMVETLVETKIMVETGTVEIMVAIAKSTANKVHAQLAMEGEPQDLAFFHPLMQNAVVCHLDVALVLINVPRSRKR